MFLEYNLKILKNILISKILNNNNKMLKIKFNHDADSVSESIYLSKQEILKVKAALIFASLNFKILSDTLFDKSDEIPKNMKTVSGSLEKSLEYLSNESDACLVYALINFNHIYDKCNSLYYLYKDNNIVDKILKDQENEMQKTIKKLFILASIKPIEILTEKIKKVNGNFELFYDEIKELLQEHDKDLF